MDFGIAEVVDIRAPSQILGDFGPVVELDLIAAEHVLLLIAVGLGFDLAGDEAAGEELPVIAGPAETTSMGNLVIQAIAMREIKDAIEARDVIINSANLSTYEPQDLAKWQIKTEKFSALFYK